jgi:hypothetical protein
MNTDFYCTVCKEWRECARTLDRDTDFEESPRFLLTCLVCGMEIEQ